MADHWLDDGALCWMLSMYRLCGPQNNPTGIPRWGHRLREVKQLSLDYAVSGGAGDTNNFWTRKEKKLKFYKEGVACYGHSFVR